MSSCLSGGSSYRLHLHTTKSQSPTTSSSTISESGNSRLAVCTRKPRTPRKRRNQSYNEAATLLSTACPAIFSTTHITKQPHSHNTSFTKQPHSDQSSDLFLPFPNNPCLRTDHRPFHDRPCLSPPEIDSGAGRVCEDDDFDAESILDEELEEGIIDSIMGRAPEMTQIGDPMMGFGFGFGFGRKIDLGFGIRRRGENWFLSPTVDVSEICPEMKKKESATAVDFPIADTGQPLLLKLNYKDVAKAWSKSNKMK